MVFRSLLLFLLFLFIFSFLGRGGRGVFLFFVVITVTLETLSDRFQVFIFIHIHTVPYRLYYSPFLFLYASEDMQQRIKHHTKSRPAQSVIIKSIYLFIISLFCLSTQLVSLSFHQLFSLFMYLFIHSFIQLYLYFFFIYQ